MSEIFQLNSLVVNIAPAFTLFGLEGEEAVDWGLHFIKEFLGVMESFYNFLVGFDILFPFLLFDVLSSGGQSLDYFSIVEGERNDSNFDWSFITFWTIDSEPGEFCQPLLHFILNVRPELTDFRDRIRFI